MICKRSSDGRKLDHKTLQAMRQQAVKAVRAGQHPADVAAAFGVATRTVYDWLAKFSNGGQTALLAKPIPGRPAKVSDPEMRWIAHAVKENMPSHFNFDSGLWTLSLIRSLIHQKYGKSLALSSVSRVMKLLGFSAQKPLYQAWQQDPERVRQWERETFPAIKAEASEVGATLCFADEAGIRSDYHTGTTWAPCGQTPVVEVTGSRFSFNMISAVSPRGDFRFMIHEGSVTSSVFKVFLQRLMTGADKPVFVIVDGHPIHKSKLVKDYVVSQKGKLKLFYLPPYSPHLNPDEQVWAHVKREVSKRFVQSKKDMKRLALSMLYRIQKLPELVRSFFRQPECQYVGL